jgi:hypothetical protein
MELKKIMYALLGAVMLPLLSCGGNNKNTTMETNDNKAVVCYFSATGTTDPAHQIIYDSDELTVRYSLGDIPRCFTQ